MNFELFFSMFHIVFFLIFALSVFFVIAVFVRIIKTIRFHAPSVSAVTQQLQEEDFSRPKSLNGMDSVLIPQIRADFPTFSARQMREEAARYAAENLRRLGMQVQKVHNVVFAAYDRYDPLRTITLQLAIEIGTGESKQQMRYELRCQNKACLSSTQGVQAINCPNCSAPLSNMNEPCPYCGSAVTAPFDMQWEFSDLQAR